MSYQCRVPFYGTSIDNLSLDEALERVCELVEARNSSYMVSLNTDILVKINKDSDFADAYRNAALQLMDSKPLFLYANAQKRNIKEKISGSDFMPHVCEVAAKKGYTCYIVGGEQGVAEKAAQNLMERFPNLEFAGTFSPEWGFEKDEASTQKLLDAIKAANPDILFVCLGSPKSELFISKHLESLNVPLSLCVGAAVDFTAGSVKRAPKWMSNIGLEWFYRFLQEPKRLFKRYFVDGWKVLPILIRHRKETF